MLQEQLNKFTAAMIAGCNAALDAGIFYNDEFKPFVIKHMGGLDCVPVLHRIVELQWDDREKMVEMRQELKDLTNTVKASPRGTYAVKIKKMHGAPTLYSFLISDGSGELAPGGQWDTQEKVVTGEYAVTKMMGYEIYSCRKILEEMRREEEDLKALHEHKLSVGMEFKDYKDPGDSKKFSKAIIQRIHADTGNVELLLTRRGTKKQWTTTRRAKVFVESVGLQEIKPDPRPLIVLVTV